MGLDTSSHAFDRALLKQRITPFLLNGDPIDDLVSRAVAVSFASYYVAEWALAVTNVQSALFKDQFALVDQQIEDTAEATKPGFFARLFGAKSPPPPPRPIAPGLPGFDTDLHVWGRPFFIDGDTPDDVADELDRYLVAVETGNDALDGVIKGTLASLERKRLIRPDDISDEMWATVTNGPSLLDVQAEIKPATTSFDDVKAQTLKRTQLWRDVLANKDLDAEVDLGDDEDEDEPMTVEEAQFSLPLELVGFMSSLAPGWMSRGHGYASNLINMLRIKTDVFETPEEPFSELVAIAPAMRDAFSDSIIDNFSLGGYVRPERIDELIQILDTHRDAMILAFDEDPKRAIAPHHLEMMSSDWRKIRETAAYAKRKGWGYIEGAEIYSGIMGMMN